MSGAVFTSKEYRAWLKLLKDKIQASQINAAIKVNHELLQLYWGLGQEIYEKELQANWGRRLSANSPKT